MRAVGGIEMAAGTGGIGGAAIAFLVHVEAVAAAGHQSADVPVDLHAAANRPQGQLAADQAAGSTGEIGHCPLRRTDRRCGVLPRRSGRWRGRHRRRCARGKTDGTECGEQGKAHRGSPGGHKATDGKPWGFVKGER